MTAVLTGKHRASGDLLYSLVVLVSLILLDEDWTHKKVFATMLALTMCERQNHPTAGNYRTASRCLSTIAPSTCQRNFREISCARSTHHCREAQISSQHSAVPLVVPLVRPSREFSRVFGGFDRTVGHYLVCGKFGASGA